MTKAEIRGKFPWEGQLREVRGTDRVNPADGGGKVSSKGRGEVEACNIDGKQKGKCGRSMRGMSCSDRCMATYTHSHQAVVQMFLQFGKHVFYILLIYLQNKVMNIDGVKVKLQVSI